MSEVDARKVIKTLFYRFNGVNPVEPNPKFMEQMKAVSRSPPPPPPPHHASWTPLEVRPPQALPP
jgi:hypothetical protein